MIKIENTKNNLGIKITGNSDSLKELSEAISRITDLQYNHLLSMLQTQEFIQNRKETILDNNKVINDNILALCDDIEDALNGKREKNKSKDKSISYSFEVLYPWSIFYVYYISSYIALDYLEEEYALIDRNYSWIEFKQDASIIHLFCLKVWGCISDILGKSQTHELYDLLNEEINNLYIDPQYIDAYCAFFYDENKNSKKLHKPMLHALCFELINSEIENDTFIALKESIEKEAEFLSYAKFCEDLSNEEEKGEKTYSELIEAYGHVDWEHIKL